MKNTGGTAILIVSLLASAVWAQGTPIGLEFQVNTYTTGSQENPAVATGPGGSFVVVWEGRVAGDGNGIGGQRFTSSGAFVGTEFQVNTFTSSEQEKPRVAVDKNGNFVVVYESHYFDSNYEGVAVQRYDSTGAAVGGEMQANTYTTDAQEHTAIAMDGLGNFVVMWDSYTQDGSAEGIFGQRFTSSGTPIGTEFQANTYTTNEQEDPDVAMDAAGNFVVVWYSGCSGSPGCGGGIVGQDGDRDGAFGQRFSSTGAKIGTEFQANTYTTGNQTDPKVALDAAGNFVVVWFSGYGQDGDNDGVFGQRFSSAGARVGTEFQINTYTSYSQENVRVASDKDGNFVVVWTSFRADGSGDAARAQRFSRNGSRLGTEFQLNSFTSGDQGVPDVAVDASGKFVAVWQSNQGLAPDNIFARRFAQIAGELERVPALKPIGLGVLTMALFGLGGASLLRRRRQLKD